MNIDRINRFIALLIQDKNNPQGVKFNMTVWSKKDGEAFGRYCYDEKDTGEVPVSCGTQACALGLAAISKEFEPDGLTYKITSEGLLCPVFGDLMEYEAAMKFFDITYNDACKLFDPGFYPRGKQRGAEAEQEVIDRLNKLIADGNLESFEIVW